MRLLNIRNFMFSSLAATQVACSGIEPVDYSPAESRAISSDSAARKEFAVDVPTGGMNLMAPLIAIVRVNGSFKGCPGSWSIEGAAGKVLGAASCESLIYETVNVSEKDKVSVLKLNGSERFTDTAGNAWAFVQTQGSKPMVRANFETTEDGSLILKAEGFTAEVAVNEGDGAICLQSDPFAISADSNRLVTVKLNPPAAGAVAGVTLTAPANIAAPVPVVKTNPDRFEINFAGKAPGTYVLTDLQATKGTSICRLKALTVTIQGDTTPPNTDLKFTQQAFESGPFNGSCGGARYVRFDERYKLWVGLVMCNPENTRYKILLAPKADATFLEVVDGGGHGQDHCELVNPLFDNRTNSDGYGNCKDCQDGPGFHLRAKSAPNYGRGNQGQQFQLNPAIQSMMFTMEWYQCGIAVR